MPSAKGGDTLLDLPPVVSGSSRFRERQKPVGHSPKRGHDDNRKPSAAALGGHD
jgi:hypothetical protein